MNLKPRIFKSNKIFFIVLLLYFVENIYPRIIIFFNEPELTYQNCGEIELKKGSNGKLLMLKFEGQNITLTCAESYSDNSDCYSEKKKIKISDGDNVCIKWYKVY